MKERYTLKEDMGTAKKGEIFIRGDLSHGVPEYYKNKTSVEHPTDWYWAQGSKLEDNRFLPASVFNNY